LNGTHQLLVYSGSVNILGESIDTVKKNTKALRYTWKEVNLKVNTERTMYMFVSSSDCKANM